MSNEFETNLMAELRHQRRINNDILAALRETNALLCGVMEGNPQTKTTSVRVRSTDVEPSQ